MKTLSTQELGFIHGGSELSTAEWATVIALTGKTFGETVVAIYGEGNGFAGTFERIGLTSLGTFAGLWLGFQLFHTIESNMH